jgi:hypothetical protein
MTDVPFARSSAKPVSDLSISAGSAERVLRCMSPEVADAVEKVFWG